MFSGYLHPIMLRCAALAATLVSVVVNSGCDTSGSPPGSAVGQAPIFAVGIPSEVMVVHAAEQRGVNWCWAASAQMALATQSVVVPQEELVRELFGSVIDVPGSVEQFINIAGRYQTPGGTMEVTCEFGAGTPSMEFLIESLRQSRPVILGCSYPGRDIGHAVVATAVICEDTTEGRQLLEVVVRDPDPSTGKRVLNAAEYQNVMYYVAYKSTPLPSH